MKIQKFNESLERKYGPTEKVYKVTMNNQFEVSLTQLINQTNYLTDIKTKSKKAALFNAMKEFIYDNGIGTDFTYELYDGQGNLIKDEKKFDEYVKNIKNYNI